LVVFVISKMYDNWRRFGDGRRAIDILLGSFCTSKNCRMNEQRCASGQSQGGIIILARSRSQSRRERGSFSPRDCERRLERQQCTFSDDLYATLATACAVDASVRPRAPRSPSSPRCAPRQPCRRFLSHSALAPALLLAPLLLLLQAAPAVARPSITYRAYRERRCQQG
jgi:hypothetical protein